MAEKRVVKILYVDEDLDERKASSMLEDVTKPLGFVCIFNVCQNTLQGLELIEIVDYDLVFVTDSKTLPIPCHSFLRLLRNIFCDIPVVLLVSNDSSSSNKITCPAPTNSINYDPILQFNATLNRPYAKGDFNQLITKMLTEGAEANMVPMDVHAQYLISSQASSSILQMARHEDMSTITPSKNGIAMRDDEDDAVPRPQYKSSNSIYSSTVSPGVAPQEPLPRWIPSIPSATLQYNSLYSSAADDQQPRGVYSAAFDSFHHGRK